jgi:hypothetical protein
MRGVTPGRGALKIEKNNSQASGKTMQNMEGPSSHLLPPVPDSCCCWGGRAKAASPDSVWGLGY